MQISDSGTRYIKLRRIKIIRANHTIFEMTDAVDSARTEFIRSACTINDQCSARTKLVEYVRKRLGQFRRKYTGQLNVGTCGVGKRTEYIENSALTNFFTRPNGMLHSRMKLGCKHKTDPNLIYCFTNLLRRKFEIQAKCSKDICAATVR